MKPYYQHAGITIYHGDSRELVEHIDADTCITDPVWPDAVAALAGREDPWLLATMVFDSLPGDVVRLAVQLGCDTDPRFLSVVPSRRGRAEVVSRGCAIEFAMVLSLSRA